MGDEIEKFDPSTLMQGVKNRIKATFVSLIPDDKWDGLVQKEVDAFFNEPIEFTLKEVHKNDGSMWGRKITIPETPQPLFRTLVWELCTEMTVKVLKDKIKEEYFTDIWVNGQYEIKDSFKKIIEEAAPKALINMMQAISFSMAQQIKNEIQNFR